jgi:hypothetical protein
MLARCMVQRDFAGAVAAGQDALAALRRAEHACTPWRATCACVPTVSLLLQALAALDRLADARALVAAWFPSGLAPAPVAALLALAELQAGDRASAAGTLQAWFAGAAAAWPAVQPLLDPVDVAQLAELYAVHVLAPAGDRAALDAFVNASPLLPSTLRVSLRIQTGWQIGSVFFLLTSLIARAIFPQRKDRRFPPTTLSTVWGNQLPRLQQSQPRASSLHRLREPAVPPSILRRPAQPHHRALLRRAACVCCCSRRARGCCGSSASASNSGHRCLQCL